MSVRLSCPSCNTGFALDAIPADHRAACPRCGDVFPIRGEVAEQASGESATPFPPSPKPATRRPKPGWSLQRSVTVALALGLLGLATGLVVHYSRGSKPPEPQPEPAIAVNATPPAQLAGLGYLPAECNLVFAVQPGPVLADAARLKQEPREFLTRSGVPHQVFATLDQLGLTLPQIDHIACGIFVGDEGDEPRVALVLVLKQPLADEDEFLKKLQASRGQEAAIHGGTCETPTHARARLANRVGLRDE
jgi:hypothetical protein